MLLDYNGLGCPEDIDHYFPPDLLELGEKEKLVDCGAYDGDTIAAFVRRRSIGRSYNGGFKPFPNPFDVKSLPFRKRLGVAMKRFTLIRRGLIFLRWGKDRLR